MLFLFGGFGPPHLTLIFVFVFFVFVVGALRFFLFCLCCFCCFLPFLSLLLIEKGHFCLFVSLPLCFSLASFGLPLFQFLSLSCSFLSFFLLVFPFCFLLVPCFSLCLSFSVFFAFVHERNNIKRFNCKCLSLICFLVFCLALSLKSVFGCLCFFPDFQLCFSTSMLLVSKTQVEKHNFLLKRGVATKRFFINLCFQNCEKIAFWGALFWANFG